VFFKEWLAGGRSKNQLPISAVCNSRCLFCSNNFNPFPIARGIFRDVEDIKMQLALMSDTRQDIRMSDSLPGRIAEGEAFLHPDFFKILRLIRRKFPTNRICFTTNGSMLDEAFLSELAKFRPIEITLSMHSTRPDLWDRIFGKEESHAAKALEAMRGIGKYRMDLVGTIVPLPRVCGWADLEQTYSDFVCHGAKSMTLYQPGYSRLAAPDAIRDMECPDEEFTDFCDRMRELHRIPLKPLPDLRGALRFDVGKVQSATLRGNLRNRFGPYRRVLWLTSEAAHGRIADALSRNAAAGGNVHTAVMVRNRTYGGNIIVGGLLMADDFIAAGKDALESHPDTELVLIPNTPFDSHERDLTGKPAYRIAEELGRPVWIVAPDGAFNPLLEGHFDNSINSTMSDLLDTMGRFNMAWKDGAATEGSLDLVDAYPLKTPWGILGRQEFRNAILREREALPGDAAPVSQGINLLDDAHALCKERWPLRDVSRTFMRWTFLVRKNQAWLIESISQGSGTGHNGAPEQ
jgi:uncharacterized Fe-S cluster-containing radical SAM superfamily protein